MLKWFRKTIQVLAMVTKVIQAGFILFLPAMILNSCTQPVQERVPKVHTVKILQMKFQPEELWVNKDDTVLFVNEDLVAHDVTQQPSSSWTSGRLEKGAQWKYVVSENVDYYCSLHKVMAGKLLVRTN